MKKRCAVLIALTLLIFLVPTAFPDASNFERIFKGDVYSGFTYNASGEVFDVTLFREELKIILDFDHESFPVLNGTCREDVYTQVCLTNIIFSHYNYSLSFEERVVYTGQLIVDGRFAKSYFEKEIEKTYLLVDDQSKIDIKFNNNGSIKVKNITFADCYPSSFEISMADSNCDLKKNCVMWKGDLAVRDTVKCGYWIKPTEAIDFVSTANFSYDSGLSFKEEKYTNPIEAYYAVTFWENLTKDEMALGEDVTLYINLTANLSLFIDSYKITIPDGLQIKGFTSDYSKATLEHDVFLEQVDDNVLQLKGRLKPGEIINMSIQLKSVGTGNQTIVQELETSVGAMDQTQMRELSTIVNIGQPYARFSKNVYSNDDTLKIFVVNPTDYTLYKIKLGLTTELPISENFETSEIRPLMHKEFNIPFNHRTDGNYSVVVLLNYETEYGESFAFNEMKYMAIGKEFVDAQEAADRAAGGGGSTTSESGEGPDSSGGSSGGMPSLREPGDSKDDEVTPLSLSPVSGGRKLIAIILPLFIIGAIIFISMILSSKQKEQNF
ncbi:MAG: hypothetical protein GY861_10020 [bacterium]|nr:hypothetical protein [bacterium]